MLQDIALSMLRCGSTSYKTHTQKASQHKARDGRTPLFSLAILGHIDMARTLLEHGAQIQHIDNTGMTPLSVAVVSLTEDTVKSRL